MLRRKLHYGLQIGTILKVYCPSKFVYHYGVMSWNNKVIDLAPRRGVALRSMYEFSEGQQVEIVQHDHSDSPKHVIHQRAYSQIGQSGYSVSDANCEHFVTWCRSGDWKSSQVEVVKTGTVIAGVILLASLFLGGDERR